MAEMWRPIPGHRKYQVSNYGRVRMRPHAVSHAGVHTYVIPEPLAIYHSATGVASCHLAGPLNGRYHIAPMVLHAFLGHHPPGAVPHHDDGDPRNCNLANLAWCYPEN